MATDKAGAVPAGVAPDMRDEARRLYHETEEAF
jgi:hypothetical protein